MGPLSRLVGRPLFEPSLSKGVLPLTIDANSLNGAISTFNRILFMFVTVDILTYKKQKTGIGEQSCLLQP